MALKNLVILLSLLLIHLNCNQQKSETQEAPIEKAAPAKAAPLPISPVYGAVNGAISPALIDSIMTRVQEYPNDPVQPDEIATLETNLGTIQFEFFPSVAPNHCRNFKRLANSGFYNGTTFHRVIPGFMIQGGDLLSRDADRMNDGSGGPGYTIDAEFSTVSHDRGIVSTAREGNDINSAGSQFFICVVPTPHLDGQYTVFGRVITGLDVIDKIVSVPRDPATDNPLQRVIMQRVYVKSKNQAQ